MKQNTMLIVDDEQKFVEMLARRLELRGIKCSFCFDGQSGIQKVKDSTFDMVLLDLRLPDIYGIEVLKEMKKIREDIKVLILTGHGTDEDRVKCLELGAYKFMQKPVNIEDLLIIMNKINGADNK